MKRLWNCWLICLLAIAGTNLATARPENRYLFILETSKEMKREAEPAKNVLLQLVYSGVMGQMKAGDTFGVWTYNDKLHAGDLPMQSFAWEDRDRVTSRTKEYLDAQKFTGAAHLENALLPMLKLATNSPNLTVILISDGKQAVAGTPFDEGIRTLHKKYYQELRDAKLPFITVLVANKGEFISYAVNSALGPVRVPRIPKAPEPTNVAPKVVIQTPKPVVKRAAEPLILRGPLPKKNSTETVPSPAPVSATAPTNSVTSAAPSPTNAAPGAPTVSTEVAKTSQAETNKIAEVVAAPVIPQPTPVATTTNQTVEKSPEAAAIKPREITPQAVPIATAKPEVTTQSTPTIQSATNLPAKEQTSNVATFTVKEPETNTTKATPVAPVEAVKESVQTTLPDVPKEEPVVKSNAPSDQKAIVAQADAPLNLRNILLGIGSILFLILVVLVMILRKAKKVHTSLITQSIDNPVKRG